MVSIPRQGGILHLPEALERYPRRRLTVYHRLSSLGQAGGNPRPIGSGAMKNRR